MFKTIGITLTGMRRVADLDYITTFRAFFKAPDDATADIVAYDIQQAAKALLDEEDGDEVVVTQTTSLGIPTSPAEMIPPLAVARNILIRSRRQGMVDLARELDRVIFALEGGDFAQVRTYDYGRFMDLMEEVMRGGNPV